MGTNFQMIATTLQGLEGVLEKELLDLGAQKVMKNVRNVCFFGDKGFMYKANICLRTAIRILKPIGKFRLRSEKDLYLNLQKIFWEDYLNVDTTIAVSSVVNSPFLTTNYHYITLKSKDAIADYFRSKYGKRPNVDLQYPDIKIHIHIKDNFCTVSLDSSGESLHKRGYKVIANSAPLNEVLAAGLVILSGYRGDTNFIDPMCGSGTILIEAAMMACRIPANINRKHFTFENWQDYDQDLYFKIQDSLLGRIRNMPCKIMGFDKSSSAVQKAMQNVKSANLSECIGVHHIDFFNSKKEVFGDTIILFNPPYGERLSVKNTESFYKRIGDTLKNNYPNTKAWFITSDISALKYVGLKTCKRISIKNAALDCRFVGYDIYEGSKKTKYQK